MKTITKKYKVYTIDELSKEAQAKAFDNYRDWNTNSWNDNGWAEYFLEEEKRKLLKYGYTDAEIFFSGFWSQGDGASFKSQVNVSRWIKSNKLEKKFKKVIDADNNGELSLWIEQSGNYVHENTMGILCNYYGGVEKTSILVDKLTDLIIVDARVKAQAIYRALREDYEYLTSDKAIREAWVDNDYQFTSDGKMFDS